jgi:hypothetical protein
MLQLSEFPPGTCEQTQRIADSYRAATVKAAWYGPSLAELLAQISPELATTPPVPGSHSISELLQHLLLWMKESAKPPTVIRCRLGSPRRTGPSRRFPGTNSSPDGAKVANCSKRRFGISPSKIWRNRFLGVTILTKLCFTESWNTRFTIPGRSR